MDDSYNCCSRSGTWAKAIGWLHIIGAIVILAAIFWAIYAGFLGNPPTRVISVAVASSVVLEVLNLIMGIVLLRGISNRNTSQIWDWLVSVIFCTVASAITIIAVCALEPSTKLIICSVLGLIVLLIMSALDFWTVNTHKKNLENSRTFVPLIEEDTM
ncbi:unnamed protein product [Allacma fusca]|uniref:Uncharacterized protein n=1 Tax=Allacma fusca TaxID=39272 RepID=A0A8J2JN02_9HEXA|nr:unnamed protein product [Allacma fusca]